MTDELLLARLIARLQPRTDAVDAARRLLDIHGSLGPVLEADPRDLSRVGGLNPNAAQILSLIPQLARYMAQERSRALLRVRTFAQSAACLRGLYLGAKNECFYLLCLDREGLVLDCALLQQGTVDETPFYLRRVLEAVLRCSAQSVVLSHNHPSGTSSFSAADIQCTQGAINALLPLGVAVLDHVLVADGRAYTLHGHPSFPEELFSHQRPGDALIAGWLRDLGG